MKDFKMICLYALLVLGVTGGIVAAIVLPEEGKIVEYRLDHGSNSQEGTYPRVIQVVENGIDSYVNFPSLTMEQGVELVKNLNDQISNK